MGKKLNINAGDKFGRWTVQFEVKGKKHRFMSCICDCGNISVISVGKLNAGESKSCGCLRNEINRQHNESGHGTIGRTVEYRTWVSIKSRCHNPNTNRYYLYGGRGIKVCNRWTEPNGMGYINFLDDMGRRPEGRYSIDRVNHDGDYEPSNCRWTTYSVQNSNRRVDYHICPKCNRTIGHMSNYNKHTGVCN